MPCASKRGRCKRRRPARAAGRGGVRRDAATEHMYALRPWPRPPYAATDALVAADPRTSPHRMLHYTLSSRGSGGLAELELDPELELELDPGLQQPDAVGMCSAVLRHIDASTPD